MTPRTRRRLTICLVVAALTLPIEAILLPVAWTPDPNVAAARWVDQLDRVNLRQAAFTIDRYPTPYRRAMMTALSAEERADAWRIQFDRYMDAHPGLSAEARALLGDAKALLTADVFTPPLDPGLQSRIDDVFKQTIATLGDEAARELFVTLGPADPGRLNALPLRQRLADSVRSWRVANARRTDCTCNVEIDTCDIGPNPWLLCSELFTCEFDLEWPMCGPLWSWACTGWCKIVMLEDN
ncbi:MAG TPA: bacteriocin fulvocin C-related protein [Vicinamibacterales bacterium]|nr:bacteriocin fulvocin C-related protein [Vicinamibacterales bacterium]